MAAYLGDLAVHAFLVDLAVHACLDPYLGDLACLDDHLAFLGVVLAYLDDLAYLDGLAYLDDRLAFLDGLAYLDDRLAFLDGLVDRLAFLDDLPFLGTLEVVHHNLVAGSPSADETLAYPSSKFFDGPHHYTHCCSPNSTILLPQQLLRQQQW